MSIVIVLKNPLPVNRVVRSQMKKLTFHLVAKTTKHNHQKSFKYPPQTIHYSTDPIVHLSIKCPLERIFKRLRTI